MIMAEDGVAKTIIPYIGDPTVDLVARQYGAMCIGNLAADPVRKDTSRGQTPGILAAATAHAG